MKFSFCSIAFRNQKITLPEIVTFLSEVGYKGVELWANHLNGIDLKMLKNIVNKYGVEVPMVSPYFDFTSGSDKWEESINIAKRFIAIAATLDVPLIRAFTGMVGSRLATKEQKENCIKGLIKVCKLAEKENIAIALETHPSTLVDNVDDTIWLIEQVQAANLKVNLDIYHMFEVHKNPLMVLEELFPYIGHIHAKNATLTIQEHNQEKHPLLHDPNPKAVFLGVKPLAIGEMDYESFIKELIRKDYQGYFSVEWFGQDPAEAAESELNYLNSIVKNAFSLT